MATTTLATTTTKPRPPSGPPPELVLSVRDPFAGDVVREETQFALYANGLVLVRDGDDIREKRVVGADLDRLRRALAPTDDFFTLDGYYESQTGSDDRSTLITVWRDGRRRAVSVADDPFLGPDAFVDLYERIQAFKPSAAPLWRPPHYELLLRPFPYDAKKLPVWPRGWPTTNSDEARRIGTTVRVALSAEQGAQFRERFGRFPAVAVEGRTWAFALHTPFPTEEAWAVD